MATRDIASLKYISVLTNPQLLEESKSLCSYQNSSPSKFFLLFVCGSFFKRKGQRVIGRSCSMQEITERYKRHTKDKVQTENQSGEQNLQLQHEAASLMKKIELLEISRRRLMGEGLQSCTLQEIQQLEKQLERSVSTIRARKIQVFKEQIARLKEKEKILAAENAMLKEKFGGFQERQVSSGEKVGEALCTEGNEKSDVETELFIGPPEGRIRRPSQN